MSASRTPPPPDVAASSPSARTPIPTDTPPTGTSAAVLASLPPRPPGDPPTVQPGASLLVALQLRGKRVLLIGGGHVASSRLQSLLSADAFVTLISPPETLSRGVLHLIHTYPRLITYHPRKFHPSDLTPSTATLYSLCLAAISDPPVSTQIYSLCHELRIPCNIADVPSECDFYFGSMHRDGPLQIMVSTNGNGPKLANLIRRQIAGSLPEGLGEAVVNVGILRRKLRKVARGEEDGPKRMEWMTKVCEAWSLQELGEMGEETMDELIESWKVWREKGGEVPGKKDLCGLEVEEVVESGSGGWLGSLGWWGF